MDLVQAINAAQAKNEKNITARIAAQSDELQSDELVLVRRFADFCKTKGVPFLPAAPATVALFLRTENLGGADYKRIFPPAREMNRLPDRALLSTRVATFKVQNEFSRL